MKNILKSLVVFASLIAFSSANAGTLEVSGTAKATYVISGGASTSAANNEGKAIGITNELAFTGSGELDNGWTWKYQVELDDTAASTFTATDDTRLELTTPYGTFAAYNTEGGLSVKYGYSAAAYGAGTDNGNSGSMQYGTAIDSYNNLHTTLQLVYYHLELLVNLHTHQVLTLVKIQETAQEQRTLKQMVQAYLNIKLQQLQLMDYQSVLLT